MPTGTIFLSPGAAVFPDGSSNNVAPGMSRRQGSQATRKSHILTIDFDGAGSTIESCWWQFLMPANYASGGTLTVKGMINGTTNAAKLQAQVAATSDGDTDTLLEHALSTAASATINADGTEARRLLSGVITLNMDSAAAGDYIQIVLFRDPSDGSDTSTADFEFVGCVFEYTY